MAQARSERRPSLLLARKSRQPLLQRPRILRRMLCTPAPAPAPATVPAITNVVLSAEERAAEIDRLQDWSMNDDAESLNHIVARSEEHTSELQSLRHLV